MATNPPARSDCLNQCQRPHAIERARGPRSGASYAMGVSTMTIGIAYDLRYEYLAAGYSEEQTAEFDRLETIDTLEHTLQGLGYETDRIGNVCQLASRLAAGARWELV